MASPLAGESALPAEVFGTGESAAPQLVFAEGKAAATGDLSLLAALWADDAVIREARGADGPADDYTWAGRDAILDRYIVAVFPNPPPLPDAPPAEAVSVDGARATLVHGVDTWAFVQRGDRWWIEGLTIGGE